VYVKGKALAPWPPKYSSPGVITSAGLTNPPPCEAVVKNTALFDLNL
jgi:hypothetical protein